MRLLFLLCVPLIVLFADYKPLTKHDIKNFSKEQIEVLNVSYQVGDYYSVEEDMGFILAAISFVENSSRMKDSNINHICGPHQINIHLNKVSCEVLENSVFASAISSLRNLEFWKYETDTFGRPIRERPMEERIRKYNVGYKKHKHQWVFLYKVLVSIKVLKEHQNLWRY